MTRVAIVDDHPVYREGLAGLLATVPGITSSAPPPRRNRRSPPLPTGPPTSF